jgi:hypothetical protein
VPAIYAVGRAPEAKLVLVRLPRGERQVPELERAGKILRVDAVRPAVRDLVLERVAEVVEDALVHVVDLTRRQCGPDLIRLSLGQEPVALLALAA